MVTHKLAVSDRRRWASHPSGHKRSTASLHMRCADSPIDFALKAASPGKVSCSLYLAGPLLFRGEGKVVVEAPGYGTSYVLSLDLPLLNNEGRASTKRTHRVSQADLEAQTFFVQILDMVLGDKIICQLPGERCMAIDITKITTVAYSPFWWFPILRRQHTFVEIQTDVLEEYTVPTREQLLQELRERHAQLPSESIDMLGDY